MKKREVRKMELTTKTATSVTNGKKRGNETVDGDLGMKMEAGTREDGLVDAGRILIGEIANGRPGTGNGPPTTLQPWIGKASSAMAEV